jgi:hypothetical protein
LPTIYQRALRERFDLLHPVLQSFFSGEHGGRASGRLTVLRPRGRLRNLVASALGVPPGGEYDLRLEVLPDGARQRWVRRFGDHVLATLQAEYRGFLVEWSGPASMGFELTVEKGALVFRRRRAWVFGLRLPLWLAPDIEAENRAEPSGGWKVRVRFRVPLLGQVAEYAGVVLPEAGTSGE